MRPSQETNEAMAEDPQIEAPEINQSEKINTRPDSKMTEIVDENIFLKSIFNTGEDKSWTPADKIPLVKKQIEILTINLKTFLESSEFDFDSIANEGQELCYESKELIKEIISFTEDVDKNTTEIFKSLKHLENSHKELDGVQFAGNIISDAISCNKYFLAYEECISKQVLSRAIENIKNILKIVENPSEGFEQTSMYTAIKAKVYPIWETLILDILAEWQQLVSWKCEETQDSINITIIIKIDDSFEVRDTINALNSSKHLETQVEEFSKFLLNDILVPIMHKECTIIVEEDEIIHVNFNRKSEPKIPYETVLNNLKLILTAINNKFNYNAKADMTLTRMVGLAIGLEFTEILKKECLIKTIPHNVADLNNYDETASEIKKFQKFLSSIRFMKTAEFKIMTYMKNIDVLFGERASQYYLETAREIMLKDLSISMSIGVESITEEKMNNEDLPVEDREALKVFDKVIPNSLFYFPRCMMSRSTQELLDLLFAMMEQAGQCRDVAAKRLYVTARLIFELYDAVVPYHHENYLNNIPQYVALFHNNCMYLAHNLQTFGDKWQVQMEDVDLDYPISFLDLVPKLRELGCKHLSIHMQQQRKQILDNIRASDLNSIVVKDVLGDNAEQAIRQCLRQLQLLKNVWIGVFPINVFTNLISTLVNMFLEELIHRVCTVEDISAEMATQLTDMYSLVVKKAVNLFHKQEDIKGNVKSWVKMQELIFVLSGSLKDIEKRWQDGTGPLAVHFRVEELRNLIKALFQNTQFRANLLSKIK